MTKPKPYSEIRDWVNVGVADLYVEVGTEAKPKTIVVRAGERYKGDAPRSLIRSGALRPYVAPEKKGGSK